jgi:hypothetical protein
VHIKPTFGLEIYVKNLDIWKFKRCLSNFRCSSHQLMIEKGRHIGLPVEDRICFHCKQSVENEYHFVIVCPLYSDLRNLYIPQKYFAAPNLHGFHLLISNTNVEVLRKLAMYLYYANKIRDSYVVS